MDNLKLGDVLVRGDGELGFSLSVKDGSYIWINHTGELELLEWLLKKNGIKALAEKKLVDDMAKKLGYK